MAEFTIRFTKPKFNFLLPQILNYIGELDDKEYTIEYTEARTPTILERCRYS